jgi:hypothetical protein
MPGILALGKLRQEEQARQVWHTQEDPISEEKNVSNYHSVL